MASGNAQLAQFFATHDHHTKLTEQEFEYVESLLFTGSASVNLSHSTSMHSVAHRTPSTTGNTGSSSFVFSSAVKKLQNTSFSAIPQFSPLIVPSSTQKKLLFVSEQPAPVSEVSIAVPVSEVPEVPVLESRPMTVAAKHLMESLFSMDEGKEEPVKVDAANEKVNVEPAIEKVDVVIANEKVKVESAIEITKVESTEPVKKSLKFKFNLPEFVSVPIASTASASLPKFAFNNTTTTASASLPKFTFDLNEYPQATTKNDKESSNLPKFHFEY